jgi:hypothetical protein
VGIEGRHDLAGKQAREVLLNGVTALFSAYEALEHYRKEIIDNWRSAQGR